MTSSSTCSACGAEVAALDESRMCLNCKTQSVVFGGDETIAGPVLPAETGAVLLETGLFVGNGRFKLISVLGRGGMGVVWLAEDCRLRTEEQRSLVALKFLAPAVRSNPKALRMMQQEVLQSRRLRHRNIITLYDWHSEDANLPFISMEYVEGETLSQRRVRQPGRMIAWRQVHPLVAQLCEALDYAHSTERIVHRDLKPGNLMVDRGGILRLADFGLAGPASYGASAAAVVRSSGTLAYMSPQQFTGHPPQPSDDIYSLGATLYEVLTSTPPFYQGNIAEQLLDEMPEPIPDRLARLGLTNPVPHRYLLLIWQCLQKNPTDRPGSIREILRALPAAQAAEGPASPGNRLEQFEVETPTAKEKNFSWVWSILLLVLCGAGTAVWFWWNEQHSHRPNGTHVATPTNELTPVVITDGPTADRMTTTRSNVDAGAKEVSGGTVTQPGTGVPASLRIVALIEPNPNASFFLRVLKPVGDEVVRTATEFTAKAGLSQSLPPGDYLIEVTCREQMTEWRESVVQQPVSLRPGEPKEIQVSFFMRPIRFETDLPEATVKYTNFGKLQTVQVQAGHPFDTTIRPGLRRFVFEADRRLDSATTVQVPGVANVLRDRAPFVIPVHLEERRYAAVRTDWSQGTLGLNMVWIDSFWMSAREITRDQFALFAADTVSSVGSGIWCVTSNGWKYFPERSWRNPGFVQGPDHPVVGVNWNEARAFCGWLTERDQRDHRLKTNQVYRLPTSEEFDRAAGSFPAGPGRGNYAGAEVQESGWNEFWDVLRDEYGKPAQDSFRRTAPVGSTKVWQTARGLFDLGGNVAEWCEDPYRPEMNAGRPGGQGPFYQGKIDPSARVVRGASWFDEQPGDIRIDTISHRPQKERYDWLGFRVVLDESVLRSASAKP